MAFLQDQTVIHIKLTDKGRELLSRGQLTFKKFGVGDSEINYEFNTNTGLDGSNVAILRPYDNNPDIVSFITEEVDGDLYTDLPSISNTTTTVTNTIDQKGMFDVSGTVKKLFNDPQHVKQANMQVVTASVGTFLSKKELPLSQTSSYVAGSSEPEVGDYVMVRWANPYSTTSTVGFNVDENIPHIFYKITGITSGSLAGNNLIVGVDRDLPDFSGVAAPYNSGAILYPNNNNRENIGDSILNFYGSPFTTDYQSLFINNGGINAEPVPVWNMTNIFTEDVIGIDPSIFRGIDGNPSVGYGGVVQYLQKIAPTVKNVGLIHYTNQSPYNEYGEGFVATPTTTPILNLPSIMWHKNINGEIGIELKGDYGSIGLLPELNTEYMDLVDQFGNVVGKVFTDIKLFVIEDQELLLAMSYKSNRSWTLPQINAGFNASLCPTSDIEITNVSTTG